MKVLKLLAIVLCLSVISISCSGDDGAMGPQGLQGEQGNQGETGETGETGTANVIYSDWIDTELSNNIASSNASFTFNAPEVDSDILNFGVVMVFAKQSNDFFQLPIVFGAARQQSYYFVASSNEIRISVHATDEGNVGNGAFLEQYRYVIIPGGQPASSSRSTTSNTKNSQVDYTKLSYKEIIELFNIPE